MKQLICSKTGRLVALVKSIANSGEGEVWKTNLNGYLAKVYHHPTPERVKKLEIMVKYPPEDPNAHNNHVSFAWVKSLLKERNGNIVGFLMPTIEGGEELINVYNPAQRRKLGLRADWLFLHVTALNIASIIAEVHQKGYVLGDIKPQNILVNNKAVPSIIDTDSFQVRDPNHGKVYRCPVGSEGFTPPELIGKEVSQVTQTEINDRFRLAVIIYHLLFGYTPFQGKWRGGGESPEVTELIRRGVWLYSPSQLLQPAPRHSPLEIVHPEVQQCFQQCFNEGHSNPRKRPSALDWKGVLEKAVNNLTQCQKIDSHYYDRSSKKCYWCRMSETHKIDLFPGNKKSKAKTVSASLTPSHVTSTAHQKYPRSTSHNVASQQRVSPPSTTSKLKFHAQPPQKSKITRRTMLNISVLGGVGLLVSFPLLKKLFRSNSVELQSKEIQPPADMFVRNHYSALNNRLYSQTWNRLSPRYQKIAGNYSEYKKWWNSVKEIKVGNVRLVQQTNNQAIVNVELEYVMNTGRTVQYSGIQIFLVWSDNSNSWLFDKSDKKGTP